MSAGPAPPTARESAREESDRLRYAWRALSVVGLASVMTALGSSALNVALPEVVRHFHAGATVGNWMLLCYMLTNTVLMVAFGRLADMFGRSRLYLGGLLTYTVASLLLGLAPHAGVLIALQAVQAAGGAMLLANSAALLTDAFPERHLARGMGVYIASFSVAQLLGPTLGGFLADRFGWQWVFWYNVPVGVVCLVWGALVLRRVAPAGKERGIDIQGNVLLLLCLGSLLFGLSQAGDRGWGDPVVLTGVLAFGALLPVFLLVERRSAHPVVDLRLFRDPAVAYSLLASFLNTVSRMCVVLLVALFYQSVHGADPVSAGARVLPLPLAAMIASATSGLLQARLQARTVAALGACVCTAGLVTLLLVLSTTAAYPPIAAALALIGLGSGLFMPSNATALMHGLPSWRIGVVNGLRLTVQNCGVVMSAALALTLITGPVPHDLRRHVLDGTLSHVAPSAVRELLDGYHLALSVLAAVSLLSVAAALGARARRRNATPGVRTQQSVTSESA
ncbi:MFS transporter [Streptomyces olivaceiscleroticus]|uniref:MFS transporter n=1 Tax=Streptomyces olivaceiscleroticus TaxID=68245 RepID=A0ABP3JGT7_9ACTN